LMFNYRSTKVLLPISTGTSDTKTRIRPFQVSLCADFGSSSASRSLRA
jgi:hypothetical protein